MIKCPHADCRKDFNLDWWFKESLIPTDFFVELTTYKKDLDIIGMSHFNLFNFNGEKLNNTRKIDWPKNLWKDDKLKIQIFQCKHCYQYFYKIFSLRFGDNWEIWEEKLIFEFPSSKIKFKSNDIPNEIINYFQEAQRCRSIWSLIWAGACLRKTVYALCDLNWIEWEDYSKKIEKLPIQNKNFTDFLTHIKWLWDDLVHNIWEEQYWKDEIDLIMEGLPLVIEDIYKNSDEIQEANKLLQKVRSKI